MEAEINLTPTASLLDIKPSERNESTQNGISTVIPARSWGLSSECTAGALLVHGLGGHSAWFEALGRRLKVQRMFVVAYDQVGFGKRIDEKFTSYSQWLDDLLSAYDYQKSLIGDKPLYIFANSMGAAVALKAAAEGYVLPAGMALFSPGIEGNKETFPLSFKLSSLWSAWTKPEKLITLPYGVDEITSNEQVRLRLAKDPLMRTRVPGRMLWELLKMTSKMSTSCAKITCPVLMLSAGQDKIVDTATNEALFSSLGTKKSSKTYEKAWHDLMFDSALDEVVRDLVAWMDANKKD